MCGRFAQINTPESVAQVFGVDQIKMEFEPNYNVAPSQNVAVVIYDHYKDKKKLGTMRWGLIPHWAKNRSIGYKMINSRAESVAEKPSFKIPFRRKRCLIPASGFYEWKKADKKKIPYFIHLKNRPLFGFAGIFDKWISPQGDELHSCSIITTSANKRIKEIHHRMPLIISQRSEDIWLDNSKYDEAELLPLLQPVAPDKTAAYRVSDFVNSVKNNSPVCIKPV